MAHVETADVEALAAAARALGAPYPGERVEDAPAQNKTAIPGPQIVMRLAQLTGLLDLAETPETVLLRERLAAADPAADIVFTAQEEAAGIREKQATGTPTASTRTIGHDARGGRAGRGASGVSGCRPGCWARSG